MRVILLAASLLCCGLACARAEPSAHWVEFASGTTPPTPFQVRHANRLGVEPRQATGSQLRGLLMRPDGEGPFPALVLLHGCDGMQPFQQQWGDQLVGWGYVVLLVDSYGPRHFESSCATWSYKHDADRDFDAHGALTFLRGLAFVDATRIGVIGWDTGGLAVLQVMDAKGVQQFFAQRFVAGVAFYPTPLDSDLRAAGPVLVLLGAADTCVPAMAFALSQQRVERAAYSVRLEVVPDAGYHFDDSRYAAPLDLDDAPACMTERLSTGLSLVYSPVAREIASGLMHRFLRQYLTAD